NNYKLFGGFMLKQSLCYFNEKKELIQLLGKLEPMVKDVEVMMVCNVKGVTINNSDYKETSIETEFLSQLEYDELINSSQEFGLYTSTYFDVNEFLEKMLKNSNNKKKISVVFETTQKSITRGKDSLISAFCDINNIIYTGPNAYVNSLCSHKYHWSIILKSHGIPTPNSWEYTTNNNWLLGIQPNMDCKLIAKPIYECASIGITENSIGTFNDEFQKMIKNKVKSYNQPFIVQEFIAGYEIEVPVIINNSNPIILPPVGISYNGKKKLGNTFLLYETINHDNYNFYDISQFNKDWIEKIKNCVLKIVHILELNGYVRIDFRIKDDGSLFVFDVNVYPHITRHSSFSKSFELLGFEHKKLLPTLISNAIDNRMNLAI
uniref:ATP-grasp domain-containing protein n=1 Tax=Paenibacillus senegalimassiliensis TaxID=1737426 RepID=UPI00073F3747